MKDGKELKNKILKWKFYNQKVFSLILKVHWVDLILYWT